MRASTASTSSALKPSHPDPGVLLSGHGARRTSVGLRLGPFDYLQKPVGSDLVEILRRAAARAPS
jgi:FixJ family two-component response regulator